MDATKKPSGLDHPVVPRILKRVSRANVWIYRRTNGRVGGKWRVGAAFRKPVPVALLTHTGRKSGRALTSPLLYLPDGDRVIFVASQGGLPKNPQWYLNLRVTPEVLVQVRGDVRRMRARTASDAERAELWPRLVELYADFDTYQAWTDRVIPVVICEPA
ncbi:nitroreductase family deazaflavin-dependent oxidoreductase [Nocardioides sp.]|uniref:nitroreductase family deazaflavin-dependent oxidoreductase n=1 Tax=Nocardioides sp. TaxID=35761 RepID=UPI002735E042|nr:nitroreductase family deazaflavin-dependent oxidoreductase [Nocardioides sp.]MDP3890908.1 nitroreductase family deazaflavin-dependent oxidoreductase [Nocardioides sp.]